MPSLTRLIASKSASKFAEPRKARAALAAALFMCALGMAQGHVAVAQEGGARQTYQQPAEPLEDALNEFSRQVGITLSFDPELVRGKMAPPLQGDYTIQEALDTLLFRSGLEAERAPGGAYSLRAAPDRSGNAIMIPAVTVEGVAGSTAQIGTAPAAYAGGDVASGGRIGALGNRSYMETPVSIAAFTSEFIEDTQALSVSDVLKYSVSAQTPQAGAVPTTDVIYVRGFNIGSFDGTFDGLPGLLGRMPPMEGVERVELLLGANAFANGQPGSVGGNINIVPKRAGAEPLLRAGLNYRTESILGATLDAGRRFGADNEFGLRANLGYSDGETELDGGDRTTFSRALSFDYRGDATRFTLDYMGNDRDLPAEAWFVILPGIDVPDAGRADRDFRQPWTFYKDNWDTVVARGEWDFAERWTLSAALGHMWTKVERLSQVSEITDNNGSMVDAFGGSLGHSRQRREGDAMEAQVSGGFETGRVAHNVRLGVAQYGDEGGFAFSGSPTYIPFASNIYDPVDYPRPGIAAPDMPSRYTDRSRHSSLFLSDELSLYDDRLRMMVGARRVKYTFESRAGGSWAGDPAKEKWSPAYGVLFKLKPDLSLYANRLEALDAGFRVDDPTAANDGAVLPPLPSDQSEIGLKGDWGKLGFTAALFEIDRPNYFKDPSTNVVGSNGRQVNRGLELSLFGEPVNGLRLYSSATFLDASLDKTEGGAFDGNDAASASRFMANLHADWDIAGLRGLALLAGVTHNGRLYNDSANTQELDAWTRLDAGLRYVSEAFGNRTVYRMTIDNLLDKQYWISERETIYMSPMRTIALSAVMDF